MLEEGHCKVRTTDAWSVYVQLFSRVDIALLSGRDVGQTW